MRGVLPHLKRFTEYYSVCMSVSQPLGEARAGCGAFHIFLPPSTLFQPCFIPPQKSLYLFRISLIMTLQAIKYSGGKLAIIDQLQLPHVEKYVTIHTSEEGWHAIKEMRVRGAPAIAIVAALALASELTTLIARNQLSSNAIETQTFITEKLHYLVSSRPTAVNLSDAAGKLETIVAESVKMPESTGHAVATAFIQAAEAMLAKDVEDNRMIGEYGAKWISENALSKNFTKATVLTHCNTG